MTNRIRIRSDIAETLLAALRERTLDDPGVTRAAYGDGEQAAHAIVTRAARDLDLEIRTDAAGNLFLTVPGSSPEAPAWIVGSHLDSVPHGGNFDGAAGVVAGLAAIASLRDSGIVPRRPVTVAAFRAEESTWFPVSYLGSRAALGLLPVDAMDARRSDTGRTLWDHMTELGLSPDRVAAGEAHLAPERIHAFVEVHIEQGPVLDDADTPIGLVTGIAGSFRYRTARCVGRYAHSGAVPRRHRQDAVFALADLVMRLDAYWAFIIEAGEEPTVTFGEIATDPAEHAFSKVPGEVSFCLDVRSPSDGCLQALQERLLAMAAEIEAERGVRFAFGPRTGSRPALLHDGLRRRFASVAHGLGIATRAMPSGAGHDTATFANAGVPSALVFVRNQNGSHNPDEAMRLDDLNLAVELLVHAIAEDTLSSD